jgi:hypothetical protein
MSRQVESHHFCSHPSEEVRQCCLFDSDKKGGRLIGVEYIISERLFKELPEEEKKYWHSHRRVEGSGPATWLSLSGAVAFLTETWCLVYTSPAQTWRPSS